MAGLRAQIQASAPWRERASVGSQELADGVKAHERLAGRLAFAGEVATRVRVFAGSVVDIAGWVPRALWEEN